MLWKAFNLLRTLRWDSELQDVGKGVGRRMSSAGSPIVGTQHNALSAVIVATNRENVVDERNRGLSVVVGEPKATK